jgi:hypothetical protein
LGRRLEFEVVVADGVDLPAGSLQVAGERQQLEQERRRAWSAGLAFTSCNWASMASCNRPCLNSSFGVMGNS